MTYADFLAQHASDPHARSCVLHAALFEATDEAFCIVRLVMDAEGSAVDYEFVEANGSFVRQTGFAQPEGKRRSGIPGLGPPHAQWLAILKRVARSGEATRLCAPVPELQRWFELHVFPIRQDEQGYVGVRLIDVTDQRVAYERLASLRRISTMGVLYWGKGVTITDANDGFLRMSGYALDELVGKTWKELTPPEFHRASEEAVRQVVTLGESTPYEKQYIRKDGSRWWGLFAGRKVGDEFVEIVLDVSERRRAEAALREADRRKDEFLATLAHELRNPLAPIRNGLHIVRLKLPGDSPALGTVHMMGRQLDHLVRLVDDLLDVARITAGKVRIAREPVALRDVLARSIEANQAAMDAKHHGFSAELPGDEVLLLGDLDRLAQVFSNLLSNAAKYTPRGGRIVLRTQVAPDEVRVSVCDSGIGIAEEHQGEVFALFTQLRDHQKHFEGGLGIGLSLVDNLVRLHGGSVRVSSEGPGTGSTFTVTLPRLRVRRDAPPESGPAPACGRLRVLVADDNGDAAESLAELLRIEQHIVVTAQDGRDAVEKCSARLPDLAFLDLGMPVMNGIEAARAIRSLPGGDRVVLVALTGWGQATDRERSLDAGFDLHVVKPITLSGLREVLALLDRTARPA